MNINVSNFRQEVSKVRLSKDAFAELLTVRELFEVGRYECSTLRDQ